MGGGSSLATNPDPRIKAFVEEYGATSTLPSRALHMDVSVLASDSSNLAFLMTPLPLFPDLFFCNRP